MVGNLICNNVNNIESCHFDGGDCCTDDAEEWNYSNWVGDGICQDESNLETCGYDEGDCCGENVNTYYCTECVCHDPLFSSTTSIPTISAITFTTTMTTTETTPLILTGHNNIFI